MLADVIKDIAQKDEQEVETREDTITLSAGGVEMIKLCGTGEIYVRGEKVDDNVPVYTAFKEWLHACHTSPCMGDDQGE